MRPELTDAIVNAIAEDAAAHARSVWKRLAGGRLRGRVEQRVDRAIERHLGATSTH